MYVPVPWESDDEKVEVTIAIPRGAAEYAVRLMRETEDQGSPVDLIRADGTKGRDWPIFEQFARMSVTGVLAEEHDKRHGPRDPND